MKRLNYACKRHVSSAISQTRHATLQHCTALMYEYTHKVGQSKHPKRMLSRYESVCLGYPYPHATNDQPVALEYLDPSHVIQFIYHHKEEILAMCQNGGPSNQSGTVKVSAQVTKATVLDAQTQHSPLFKHIVQMATKEKGQIRAIALIDRLYQAWQTTQSGQGGDGDDPLSDARQNLTEMILQELLPKRYETVHTQNLQEQRLATLRKERAWLCEVVEAVSSYRNFVQANGHKIASGALKEIPKWTPVGRVASGVQNASCH